MFDASEKLSATHDAVRVVQRLRKNGYHSAILAGGAVRDSFLGREVSDYDIYVWDPRAEGNPEPTAKNVKSITDSHIAGIFDLKTQASFMGLDRCNRLAQNDHKYCFAKHLSEVWSVHKGGDEYQICFVTRNPVEYINTNFDIGICKAYCDGKRIHYTTDFLNDVRNQTLTLCSREFTQEHFDYVLDDHLDRMKRKFPNHKVVVANHNWKFVNSDNENLVR